MTYYENDNGGFVFAIGPISFGGSLPVGQNLQPIARNALDACLRAGSRLPNHAARMADSQTGLPKIMST
jgi:hypothetical protein